MISDRIFRTFRKVGKTEMLQKLHGPRDGSVNRREFLEMAPAAMAAAMTIPHVGATLPVNRQTASDMERFADSIKPSSMLLAKRVECSMSATRQVLGVQGETAIVWRSVPSISLWIHHLVGPLQVMESISCLEPHEKVDFMINGKFQIFDSNCWSSKPDRYRIEIIGAAVLAVGTVFSLYNDDNFGFSDANVRPIRMAMANSVQLIVDAAYGYPESEDGREFTFGTREKWGPSPLELHPSSKVFKTVINGGEEESRVAPIYKSALSLPDEHSCPTIWVKPHRPST